MTTLSASEARAKLYKLLDEAASSHEPIQITGKRNNAVLVSEEEADVVPKVAVELTPSIRLSCNFCVEEPSIDTLIV